MFSLIIRSVSPSPVLTTIACSIEAIVGLGGCLAWHCWTALVLLRHDEEAIHMPLHPCPDPGSLHHLPAYRTHLTSFPAVLGFEVSRYSAINDRACSVKPFSARKWRNPASCKAFASRIRSQMGFVMNGRNQGYFNELILKNLLRFVK